MFIQIDGIEKIDETKAALSNLKKGINRGKRPYNVTKSE